MTRLLIDQITITRTHTRDTPQQDPATGEARMRIQRFALTANNVTYAAAGFVIGYWSFFPSGIEGHGMVPVWGFADVVESQSEDLAVGQRLYGFWPLADEVVISPKALSGGGILDAAPHRQNLPPVYNRYNVVKPRGAQDEALQSLLQPLLATSYLLSDWLEDNAFFNSEQVIVGSSSSKTGLGLTKFLAALEGHPVKVIGLTSASNTAFVEGLKSCDQVVTYDEIETLDPVPSVYVDMAGNADVKHALHVHLGDMLKHSSAVGTSHWDKFAPKLDLPGPKPQFFFAPAQIEKRRADWGPGVIESKIGTAWREIAAQSQDWLDVKFHTGIDAARQIYLDLAEGRANPRDGHVIDLV